MKEVRTRFCLGVWWGYPSLSRTSPGLSGLSRPEGRREKKKEIMRWIERFGLLVLEQRIKMRKKKRNNEMDRKI